jgi:hypothetical protein
MLKHYFKARTWDILSFGAIYLTNFLPGTLTIEHLPSSSFGSYRGVGPLFSIHHHFVHSARFIVRQKTTVYRTGGLHRLGHFVTAAALRDMLKEISCMFKLNIFISLCNDPNSYNHNTQKSEKYEGVFHSSSARTSKFLFTIEYKSFGFKSFKAVLFLS